MKLLGTTVIFSVLWLVLITGLHGKLNLNWFVPKAEGSAKGEKYKIGFLPVTCHLTCPVTDFINKETTGDGIFEPVRFSGWPELKEAYLSGYTPATFILAPMAIALREQGVPIKIVYLGHRDGSAVMVHKDSKIYRMEDLRGKKVAVPNRYSNQRLLIFRALKQAGMTVNDIQLVEMPPPDMPAALYSKAVDAISSGEPFMAQTELDGYGRVLWLTKDVWPNFISCVLAVHEDMIKNDRPAVQKLVDGIASSGKWLDETMEHRMDAAQFVAKNYYNQHPRLLTFVLSKPPDRVKYTNLALRKKDFEEIEELGKDAGIVNGSARFEDYTDTSFVPDESLVKPYVFEGTGKTEAK
ncbi:NitT/TauT family transport system substrate-binding protein [Prosthecobacter debontii]|uniref:NitT/TauT family transport system substrate-binding protein n=1 Tax=Prosthecobacter debontii TaxID=48467 RepID=A0A1T4Y9Q3_9BACT|nr:ABC transporter substrate-binding protein [Prosthecobacter debontii]SKA98486.1 NitT/TauT family transport system substrate-binding protein [Prosthecobacter debontii]